MAEWPEWWKWELELSPHLLKRMLERGFSETDLRLMMENTTAVRADDAPGRWIVETIHDSRPWNIIVEPDPADRLLVVITAYSLEQA